jgi:hypothetical protein
MDHIPLPSGCPHSQIEVPYVVTDRFAYTGSNFLRFPLMHGFSLPQFIHNDFKGRSLGDVLSFLQSWAFFGLLREVTIILQVPVNLDDYVRERADGKMVLTTRKLPERLSDWEFFDRAANPSERLARLSIVKVYINHVLPYLKFAEDHGKYLSSSQEMDEQDFDLVNTVFLSIYVLIEALATPITACKVYPQFKDLSMAAPSTASRSLYLLRRRFLAAGWCPKAIALYEHKASSPTCCYFASGIDRRAQHADHSSCSTGTCELLPKDEMLYKPLHAEQCDQIACGECVLQVDQIQEMGNLLQRNQWAVITVEQSLAGEWHVDIHPVSEETQAAGPSNPTPNAYVAISHVWAEYYLPPCTSRQACRNLTFPVVALETRAGMACRSVSYEDYSNSLTRSKRAQQAICPSGSIRCVFPSHMT